MAAVGTARMAPTMPSRLPPISRDTITVTALTHLPLHDLRHEHVVLELLLDDEEDDDQKSTFWTRPSTPPRSRDRRQDRTDDRDHLADRRRSARGRRRTGSQQPQADRRRDADDRPEQQLAPSHALTLPTISPAGRRDARAILRRTGGAARSQVSASTRM